MNYIIIPARLDSNRLERKVLRKVGGKPLIQHTYENCQQCGLANDIIIATDSKEIMEECNSFATGKIVMTHKACNGTDRVIQACDHLIEPNCIVNCQADHPRVNMDDVDNMFLQLEEQLEQSYNYINTLAYQVEGVCDETIYSGSVKVVVGELHQALYFSRALIPNPCDTKAFLIHTGVYGYTRSMLTQIRKLMGKTYLGDVENLEQLDWLSYSIATRVNPTNKTISIDTESDLEDFAQLLQFESLR